jgi:polyisoprenoid-binding protein YceI
MIAENCIFTAVLLREAPLGGNNITAYRVLHTAGAGIHCTGLPLNNISTIHFDSEGAAMNARTILGISAIGLVLSAALGLAPQGTPTNPAATTTAAAGTAPAFAVDAVHSSVMFKINHMGVTNFYGRFNEIEGSYVLDEANHANSTFEFTVKADSVDTNSDRRDGHLKSADFFNVAEYPNITFRSTKVAKAGDNKLTVTGNLTLHGVTKPVDVEMKLFPAKETRQGHRGGFESHFTIKRTDFGMDTYVAEGGLGDEVTILVAVEAARKDIQATEIR